MVYEKIGRPAMRNYSIIDKLSIATSILFFRIPRFEKDLQT